MNRHPEASSSLQSHAEAATPTARPDLRMVPEAAAATVPPPKPPEVIASDLGPMLQILNGQRGERPKLTGPDIYKLAAGGEVPPGLEWAVDEFRQLAEQRAAGRRETKARQAVERAHEPLPAPEPMPQFAPAEQAPPLAPAEAAQRQADITALAESLQHAQTPDSQVRAQLLRSALEQPTDPFTRYDLPTAEEVEARWAAEQQFRSQHPEEGAYRAAVDAAEAYGDAYQLDSRQMPTEQLETEALLAPTRDLKWRVRHPVSTIIRRVRAFNRVSRRTYDPSVRWTEYVEMQEHQRSNPDRYRLDPNPALRYPKPEDNIKPLEIDPFTLTN